MTTDRHSPTTTDAERQSPRVTDAERSSLKMTDATGLPARPAGMGALSTAPRPTAPRPTALRSAAFRPEAARIPAVCAVLAATALSAGGLSVATATPAAADSNTQCEFDSKPYEGRPWALQRVLLDELWKESKGDGQRVAVIDTGVDTEHKQLKDAVDAKSGTRFLEQKKRKKGEPAPPRLKKNGTTDLVGHGTKVAGIIAARPAKDTGFVGIAPESEIVPIQQNDAEGSGDTKTLAKSINYAVEKKVDVINISQDTEKPIKRDDRLWNAVNRALEKGIVVVASAGNDGLDGKRKRTYPAAYEGVIAVASSDRNNERAPFSQSGDFVDVAAPGVDMVSTVPKGGHCQDNGTSFSAPYVAGVAALLKEAHPGWSPEQIRAQIAQTAERSIAGHDQRVGWGVVDPVRAVTDDDQPVDKPSPKEGVAKAEQPQPVQLQSGETEQERSERIGTYAVLSATILVGVVAGGAVVVRERRRRGRT